MVHAFLGLSFAIFGYLTSRLIKNYFSSFYTENRCMLYAGTIGLSLPLLLRGLYNLLDVFDSDIGDQLDANYVECFICL